MSQPLERGNLLAGVPAEMPEEYFQTLAAEGPVRIERIVSRGHRSPPEYWYEQTEHEWVLLIQGAAGLRLGPELHTLAAGDFLWIPAGCRHRVEWTDPNGPTIWLAVFWPGRARIEEP